MVKSLKSQVHPIKLIASDASLFGSQRQKSTPK